MLLHGSAGSSALWRVVAESFTPLYDVVSPDLIGYGAAMPWRGETALTLRDEAQRVEEAIPCCERRFHLAGYSYGGAVALQLALESPMRIASLTLIEPVFFAALRYADRAEDWETFVQLRRVFLRAASAEEAMQGFMDFWTGAGSWARLAPRQQAAMLAMAPKIALDFDASFGFDPGADALRVLGGRTLMVRGDRSPLPMRNLVDSLHGLMPGSTHAVIRGADHLLPMTHGAPLAASLASHLHAVSERSLR